MVVAHFLICEIPSKVHNVGFFHKKELNEQTRNIFETCSKESTTSVPYTGMWKHKLELWQSVPSSIATLTITIYIVNKKIFSQYGQTQRQQVGSKLTLFIQKVASS